MIYFINFGMPSHKSGIEHAELKRLNLFKNHHQPAKIIARDWNRELHKTANASGVDDDSLLGMFDYFQDAEHVPTKKVTVEDLDFGLENTERVDEPDKNRYLVTSEQGKLVARVNYDPNEDKQVVSTELFDEYGNLYRVDHYDSRGFRSLIQWYTPDNHVGNEEWLTPDGKTMIRTFNKFDIHHKLVKTGWWLQEKNGEIHTFDTIDELFEHFLNRINEKGNNIFVLDRSLLADGALTRLKKPAYTVMHLHNSQAGDAQDPLHSIVNNNYEYALANLDEYSAVVSATQRQTDDVVERFKPKAKMYTIPVGIVDNETLNADHISEDERTFGKVIAVARIAYEKRLDDLVRAVKLVHDEVPEVTLDLYGYADSSNNYGEKKKIEKLIKELKLEDVVTFKGYTTNIPEIEDKAQVFGLTSRMEGFNLAIMEAISHGVVGITYDVNYGPNDIVQDKKNGYIVDFGDYKALADRMIKVFKDKKLMQQLSDGAYESSERYSDANVWKAWKELIDDAKETLKDEVR
ncbi:glycosyltransferase [Lactobacillus sp. PV037]|uniref:glycosyltransferase n=1 Tax=Lactobacillus sp. PV037 TaxID=2594496 RepID=UPI0022403FCA|nr:glycosyltransferase [Lactobacillus sp. PV037]QNQ83983.1 glycosyltransferase [Lactobacillus sp. PV037]